MEIHKLQIVIVVARLALWLVVPLIHFTIHKLIHLGLHKAESIDVVEKLIKKWHWLPDVLMIGSLATMQLIYEPHD